jgi:branched-chain amino acid transport system ATP-binding protein
MLRIDGLSAAYGTIKALHQVSMAVDRGEIVSIIGANGAGKTTLLMAICGAVARTEGQIIFDDTDISAEPTHRIVARGIAHAPEGRRIFPRMTVWENLILGAITAPKHRLGDDLDRVLQWFPILRERLSQRGGTLSGGEQQMLAIGRALMATPRLLLLDEPSLGLAPMVVRRIFQVIHEINRSEQITILLVEQNANQALHISDRGYVLANGRIQLAGPAAELLNNEEVRAAYLEGARREEPRT